jgi:hypothetical protein
MVSHVPNLTTSYSSLQSDNITSPLIDTRSRIISDYLIFSAYTKFVVEDIDTLKDPKYEFVRIANPIEPIDELYKELTVALQLGYLEQLEQVLEADKQKEDIILGNIQTYESTAVFDFDGFLDDLIDIGVDFLLEQVNKLLPPAYQLDVSVQDGEFVGFSVAGVGYNAKENTLTYDGRLFDALLRDGLDILNDLLPDFLQAELGLGRISFGAITIDFDDLENGEILPVIGDISISKIGGDIVVNVAGNAISVYNTLENLAKRGVSNLIGRGLASINSQLPEGLDVGVSFGNGSLLPTVSVGPVSFNLATGALGVNVASLNSLITTNLNRYVFRQLPGPLGAIARAAWRAVDLGAIFAEIIPPAPPSPDKTISLNVRGEPSLPPLVSSPPMVGNFPQIERASDDIA